MRAAVTTVFAAWVLTAFPAWADQDEQVAAGDRPADAIAAEHEKEREALEPAVTMTAAMDSLELDTTEVTGNRELPKVLYIVPWRKADPGDLDGRPVNSLIEEVLAPLDREEFIRQVDYYSDLADTATGEDFEDRR